MSGEKYTCRNLRPRFVVATTQPRFRVGARAATFYTRSLQPRFNVRKVD